MTSLDDLACDPRQYDNSVQAWANVEAGLDTGTRRLYLQALGNHIDWPQERLLDIGCGTGWLVDYANRMGAEFAEGIDPSRNNIARGRNLYPKARLHQKTAREFNNQRIHDPDWHDYTLITAVMSFNHLSNGEVFSTLYDLRSSLVREGRILLIVPDFEYSRTPRYDYVLKIEPVEEELIQKWKEYAIQVTRPEGTITDIVRRIELYEALIPWQYRLDQRKPLRPCDFDFPGRAERFAGHEKSTIAWLLELRKA